MLPSTFARADRRCRAGVTGELKLTRRFWCGACIRKRAPAATQCPWAFKRTNRRTAFFATRSARLARKESSRGSGLWHWRIIRAKHARPWNASSTIVCSGCPRHRGSARVRTGRRTRHRRVLRPATGKVGGNLARAARSPRVTYCDAVATTCGVNLGGTHSAESLGVSSSRWVPPIPIRPAIQETPPILRSFFPYF